MITYNWLQMRHYSEGKPKGILEALEFITYPRIPNNRYDVVTKQLCEIDWKGNSFILNPEAILEHKNFYSNTELAEYVGLASFRNLAEYITTGQKTLSIADSPLNIETIKSNRLLTLTDGKVYFRWEETTH